MPRPKKPPTERADQRFCVCLKTDTVDSIYKFASLQGESAGPVVRRVLERVFGMLETSSSRSSCYGDTRQPSASTMRFVLTGSPPGSGVRLSGADSPDLDRRE